MQLPLFDLLAATAQLSLYLGALPCAGRFNAKLGDYNVIVFASIPTHVVLIILHCTFSRAPELPPLVCSAY